MFQQKIKDLLRIRVVIIIMQSIRQTSDFDWVEEQPIQLLTNLTGKLAGSCQLLNESVSLY